MPSPCASGAALAANSPDAALAAIAQRCYRETWRFQPNLATATGVHEYDAQLGSFTASDFEAFRQRISLTAQKMQSFFLP